MSGHPTEIRRALKRLGYTNQQLADELTSARGDSLSTSPATVSRWVSGAAPAEPALVLYLKERLAQQVFTMPTPRLPTAQKIAVGGGKGGSGASTVAAALAVQARDLGYRVALRQESDACNNPLFQRPSPMSGMTLIPGIDQRLDDSAFDFIITDIASRSFHPKVIGTDAFVDTYGDHDLVLVTCNLSSAPDSWAARDVFRFFDGLAPALSWAALQVCDYLYLPVFLENLKDFQPWLPRLLPRPVISKGAPLTQGGVRVEFASDEASNAFHWVLEDVCQRLGVELYERPRSFDELRTLSLGDLLETLGA